MLEPTPMVKTHDPNGYGQILARLRKRRAYLLKHHPRWILAINDTTTLISLLERVMCGELYIKGAKS